MRLGNFWRICMTRASLISVIFAAAFAASCGGGGGGDLQAPAASNNLAASALQVNSPEPRIGYPLRVTVSITAEQGADDVSVSLFAVERNSDPAALTRQTPLGTQVIPRVEAGSHPYELEINIPSSVELPGAYHIAAVVNPVNEVPETAEADNVASSEATLSPAGSPNVFIIEAIPDRTVLELDSTSYAEQVPGAAGNVHNSDAGATVQIGTEGLAVGTQIDLQAFASLRLTRSDRGTSHVVPLYLWNSDAGRYNNAFGVDPAAPPSFDPFGPSPAVVGVAEWLPIGQGLPRLVRQVADEVTIDDVDRRFVHLDFYFPGKLADELRIALRHLNVLFSDPYLPPPDLSPRDISDFRSFLFGLPVSSDPSKPFDEGPAMAVMGFEICVQVRPADPAVVDRFPADNELCTPIAIKLPAEPPPIPVPQIPIAFTPQFSKPAAPVFFNGGYQSRWDGKAFGYGLDFGASSSADHRGLIVESRGSIPVAIFGNTIGDLMNVVARGQALPDYSGKPTGQSPGFTLQLRFADQMLLSVDKDPIATVSVPFISFSKEKKFPEPTLQLVPGQVTCKLRFMVGPVALCLESFVNANIGVGSEVGFLPNGFNASIGPSAHLEAGASAFAAVPFFDVGVRGVVTLVEEKFGVTSAATLNVADAGLTSGIAEIVITPSLEIANEITGASGKVEGFAKYEVPSFRKCSWGFFTGLCPTTRSIETKVTIKDFGQAFKKKDVLFKRATEIDVVVVPGVAPAYYSP
jgi:hypothetical protein